MAELQANSSELSSEMSLPSSNPATPGTSVEPETPAPEIAKVPRNSRISRLNFLVEKSKIYSNILSERLIKTTADEPSQSPKKLKGQTTIDMFNKKAKREISSYKQPKLLSGGKLQSYQLDGVEWMVSLYENGLNGILADEMGLGKTIQTIAFLAHLIEKAVKGPFLVVGPLSTVDNWCQEFAKFAPSINVVRYQGSIDKRAKICRSQMRGLKTGDVSVLITSYEMIIKDAKYLNNYEWKYVIVDEGHRLKNMNCKLIMELKRFSSANRLLLTGTPLQNNLTELWSLLNFLLPEIFSDLALFHSWFDQQAEAGEDDDGLGIDEESKTSLVSSLHAILRPFLLRRVKADVDLKLPNKREYIIYSQLTPQQAELYSKILEKTGRDYIIKCILEERGHKLTAAAKRRYGLDEAQEPVIGKKRRTKPANYKELEEEDILDSEVDLPSLRSRNVKSLMEDKQAMTELMVQSVAKEASSKSLANIMMQLRQVSNSPYLFYYPWTSGVDDRIVRSSSKMVLLDRLLKRLLPSHKTLVFSQFTRMLDLLEDYCVYKGISYCRFDGSSSQDERSQQIKEFNENPEVGVFLLSTRSAGLGINLSSADTVILYDSDWNPYQDMQAMDRVHRIGQKKPVLVFRLATKDTVEEKLLKRAAEKRDLEHTIIERGNFKGFSLYSGKGEAEVLQQIRQDLVDRVSGTEVTESDLQKMLDRSPKAYANSGEKFDGDVLRA